MQYKNQGRVTNNDEPNQTLTEEIQSLDMKLFELSGQSTTTTSLGPRPLRRWLT